MHVEPSLSLLCIVREGSEPGINPSAAPQKPADLNTKDQQSAIVYAPHTSATMRIRSAIVVGSFAAASGAFPQLSIPPEAGKGANSKWHLPPRIRPRAGASDGPTAAREPPLAPAPRGA